MARRRLNPQPLASEIMYMVKTYTLAPAYGIAYRRKDVRRVADGKVVRVQVTELPPPVRK